MVPDVKKEIVTYGNDLYMQVYKNNLAEDYQKHWHSDVEIIVVLESTYTVTIEGVSKYILRPGDIMVIPSGACHELIAPSSGKRIIILFNNSRYKGMNDFSFLYNGTLASILIRSNSKNAYYQQLYSLIDKITEEYTKQEDKYEMYIYSMLMLFFSIIARNCMKKDREKILVKKRKMQAYTKKLVKVCKYIEDNCTKDIRVDELSELAGYSNSHFSRIFHEFIGDTYYDYITKQRISLAEEMLSNSEFAIVDIAMRSGFNSLATFNRNFRKIKKCTPSEFRRKHGVHSSYSKRKQRLTAV